MTKILSCTAVVGLLIASSSALAGGGHGLGATPGIGASSFAPGHEIKTGATGSVGGPGASGYAPGRQYIDSGRATIGGSPGASGYTPRLPQQIIQESVSGKEEAAN
jgi:hypothetical protein